MQQRLNRRISRAQHRIRQAEMIPINSCSAQTHEKQTQLHETINLNSQAVRNNFMKPASLPQNEFEDCVQHGLGFQLKDTTTANNASAKLTRVHTQRNVSKAQRVISPKPRNEILQTDASFNQIIGTSQKLRARRPMTAKQNSLKSRASSSNPTRSTRHQTTMYNQTQQSQSRLFRDRIMSARPGSQVTTTAIVRNASTVPAQHQKTSVCDEGKKSVSQSAADREMMVYQRDAQGNRVPALTDINLMVAQTKQIVE